MEADTAMKSRLCAAVIGATVADAAGQPTHWIYNEDKLTSVLETYGDPEFIMPSQNPFYSIETGKQTCYGDQAYAVLKSLVSGNGLVKDELVKAMVEILGSESIYEKETVNGCTFDKTKQKVSLPLSAPWRNASIKEFLSNHDQGLGETGSEGDMQIDSVTRIAPVVALYAGRKEMLYKVEEMVRVTQNNDVPVAFALAASRILEYYILNGPKKDALEKVIKELRNPARQNPTDLDSAIASHFSKVVEAKNLEHKVAVASFGRN